MTRLAERKFIVQKSRISQLFHSLEDVILNHPQSAAKLQEKIKTHKADGLERIIELQISQPGAGWLMNIDGKGEIGIEIRLLTNNLEVEFSFVVQRDKLAKHMSFIESASQKIYGMNRERATNPVPV